MASKQRKKRRQRHHRQGAAAGRKASRQRVGAPSLSHQSQAVSGLLARFDELSETRAKLDLIAQCADEYAGIPMPLEDEELAVHPSFAFAPLFERKESEIPDGWKIRNTFYSRKINCYVQICETPEGKLDWRIQSCWNSVTEQMRTMACSDAWGIEQEANALQLLATLLPHRQFKRYLLSSMFLERSKRSGVMYLFRKLRPTVAVSMNGKECKILAALCMHPIAYYAGTWAGAMCPTDDVIAHLMLMRGDEHMFWRKASQHRPRDPQAGL